MRWEDVRCKERRWGRELYVKVREKKNLISVQEFGRNAASPWLTSESSYKRWGTSQINDVRLKLSRYSCSYSVLLQLKEITCYQELVLIKVTCLMALFVFNQPWHIKSFSFTYVGLNLLKLLAQMCLWRSNNDISLFYDIIKEQRIHSAEENRFHFH